MLSYAYLLIYSIWRECGSFRIAPHVDPDPQADKVSVQPFLLFERLDAEGQEAVAPDVLRRLSQGLPKAFRAI